MKPTPVPVRQIRGYNRWFIAEPDLKSATKEFDAGILTGVTFNPSAEVMKDVFCGTNRVSEAEAIGMLEVNSSAVMPSDAVRTCTIGYDTARKVFFNHDKPTETLTQADYVLLEDGGKAIAGWKH